MPVGVLLINPKAGHFRSPFMETSIVSGLGKKGWEIIVEKSTSSQMTSSIAYRAANENLDALFVAGGDGTVNCVVNMLQGSETALGIIPSGTANVFAKELGYDRNRHQSIDHWLNDLTDYRIRNIDVGECNGKSFLLWAGVGLDGYIVHNIEPRGNLKKLFPMFQYALRSLQLGSRWNGMLIEGAVDGRDISGNYILALISNIRLYAGGMVKVSSSARLDDGVMELLLLKGNSVKQTYHHIWKLLSGRFTANAQAVTMKFKNLQLESLNPMYIQLDGEPADKCTSMKINIQQGALKVLVPNIVEKALFKM